MNQQSNKSARIFRIILLILAGESIFILPFVLARIFRPTFLDVFQLNNTQLGVCFSICGTVSLFSYLYGGAIADKFSPRKLIATALWFTALGGFVMATFPSFVVLKFLYGYWGFTTIFLFWAAMIKATRTWGGSQSQGKAFGYLEGGRGFVAASIGAIGVLIFAKFLPVSIASASITDKQIAFRQVILFVSVLVAFVGVLVYIFLKSNTKVEETSQPHVSPLKNIKTVLKYRTVWLLMIIVLCGYVGYKLTDIFSLYASEIMSFSQVEAAQVGTFQLYLRPLVCILVGIFADRTRSSTWLIIGFVTMLVGALIFATGMVTTGLNLIFILSLVITATGTYAIRTLYFAALQEGKIPLAITGAAVGAISVVGYTPDIFVGPILGFFLDGFTGILGYQFVFSILALFSIIGLVSAISFRKFNRR